MHPSALLRSLGVQDSPKLPPIGQESSPPGRSIKAKSVPHRWTAEELRIVGKAQAKGLGIKAFVHLLPGRTYVGIANVQARIRGGDADKQVAPVRWSTDEKTLIRDLNARA